MKKLYFSLFILIISCFGVIVYANQPGTNPGGTGSGGTGNVQGPASSTNTAIARFSGTSGTILSNSSVLLDGSGNLTQPASAILNTTGITNTSTSNTLAFSSPLTTGSSSTDFTFNSTNTRTAGNLFNFLNNGNSLFNISTSGSAAFPSGQPVEFDGDINVFGEASIAGVLNSFGVATFSSDVNISGTLTALSNPIVANAGITSSGNISTSSGNITSSGTVTSGTTITAATGLTVTSGDATINSGNVSIAHPNALKTNYIQHITPLVPLTFTSTILGSAFIDDFLFNTKNTRIHGNTLRVQNNSSDIFYVDYLGNATAIANITAGTGLTVSSGNATISSGTISSTGLTNVSSSNTLTFSSPLTTGSSSTDFTFNSTNTRTSGKLLDIQNNSISKLNLDTSGNLVGTGNITGLIYNGTGITNTSTSNTLAFSSPLTAGSSATDFTFNTTNTRTAGKIFDIQNNGSSLFNIDTGGRTIVMAPLLSQGGTADSIFGGLAVNMTAGQKQYVTWGEAGVAYRGAIGFDNGSGTMKFYTNGTFGGGTGGVLQMSITSGGAIAMPSIGTTVNVANTFLDNAASNNILRVTSSKRYKKNISEWSPNLDNIYKLNTKQYDHKERKEHGFGLIAEEVELLFPEIVVHIPENVADKTSKSDKLIPDSLNYPLFGVLAIDELKRCAGGNKSLSSRLDSIEKRIDILEKRLANVSLK